MPTHIELEDILSRNPQIDQDELEKAREMLRHLREQGVRRKDYDLAPPFGGQRVSVRDGARTEPRLIQQRGSYGAE